MNVSFYNVKIKKNEIDKSLGSAIVKTCELKNGSSVEDPVLYMVHDATLFNCNYVYIPDFGRYYFIVGREIAEHTEYITCHVDVLKTFENDIRESTVISTRSNFLNKQFNDNMIKPQSDKFVEYRKLGSALSGETYVAIIGG